MKKVLIAGLLLLSSGAYAKDCKLKLDTTMCKGAFGEHTLVKAHYYISIGLKEKAMEELTGFGSDCHQVDKNTKMKVLKTQRTRTFEDWNFQFYTKKVIYNKDIWYVESKSCK